MGFSILLGLATALVLLYTVLMTAKLMNSDVAFSNVATWHGFSPVLANITCITTADDKHGGHPLSAECMEVGDSRNRRRPNHVSEPDQCLLNEEPDDYFQLLGDILVGLPLDGRCNFGNDACTPPHHPYDEKMRRFGDDWPPRGFTMIGKERLANFRAAILEVERNGIPGAIAEFGVWRGGAMIMAAALQRSSKSKRDLYLFDAFGSFGGYGRHEAFLAVPQDEVEQAFRSFRLLDPNNIHFVKGMFSETVSSWNERTDEVAVLRVDGNFYDSYQDVMYAMYENVPVGGIVIFDDVFHPHYKDVMQFWNDFKSDHGLPEELVQIDGGSGWFRKKRLVQINQNKKRKRTEEYNR